MSRTGPPKQRTPAQVRGADRARSAHLLLRRAWERLHAEVAALDEDAYAAPTLLPGWTRAHLITHLARGADALVNLLTWARTGIEHQPYASRADRAADIEAGAHRLPQVVREDLHAACGRFHAAVAQVADDEWAGVLTTDRDLPAAEVVELALVEAWLHLVDLGTGVGWDDIPGPALERVLGHAARPHLAAGPGRVVPVVAELPDGSQRGWELTIVNETGRSGEVRGSAARVLAWLSRGETSGLAGEPPRLPAWG